jgi:hypothetical protein
MDQLNFDFEAFNQALNVERALIAKDNEEYFSKRDGRSIKIEKPIYVIKYPELNEDGYTKSSEVISSGQLRLEQAIKRVNKEESK